MSSFIKDFLSLLERVEVIPLDDTDDGSYEYLFAYMETNDGVTFNAYRITDVLPAATCEISWSRLETCKEDPIDFLYITVASALEQSIRYSKHIYLT